MITADHDIMKLLDSAQAEVLFSKLYGNSKKHIAHQVRRYKGLVEAYRRLFPENHSEIQLFSTSGRTEVGGNHTDHNGGHVLAAAVNLDSVAAAAKNDTDHIIMYSEGYSEAFRVHLDLLAPQKEEEETTTAIIRGIAGRFKQLGYNIGGFDAYISSDVLKGSGLSSSASIEVLIGTIMNTLYNESRLDPQELAMIGQYAENVYFNKPCGLMDQMACAVGGFVAIDFKDADNPVVKKIDFDVALQGFSLLVVDTGGSHADLTADYADVPGEMKQVAEKLGKRLCSEITMAEVINDISILRGLVGDRAILRAMHFFADDQRVVQQAQALEEGRFDDFLSLVTASGNSSWKWLQNCYTTQNPLKQGVTLALAVTENFLSLRSKGAYRVHGGGFAGTIQVYMPDQYLQDYVTLMENIFGENKVTLLTIRPYGTIHLNAILCS